MDALANYSRESDDDEVIDSPRGKKPKNDRNDRRVTSKQRGRRRKAMHEMCTLPMHVYAEHIGNKENRN